MNKTLKPIPAFANEAAERTFWETHDSTAYVDWSKAKRIAPMPAETSFRLRAARGRGKTARGLALLTKAASKYD